ncbi:hypothetical protein BH20GEM1_BH20GEM1_05760 [soil metagenome]
MRHHGAALRNLTDNAQWARAFERDFRSACPDLEPPDRALLDYVEKLTMAPASVSLGDVQALRVHGFDDRMIHDAAAVTAYFGFVNRLAEGLGVDLESYWEDDPGH